MPAKCRFLAERTARGLGVSRVTTSGMGFGMGGSGLITQTTMSAGWPMRCLEAVAFEEDPWHATVLRAVVTPASTPPSIDGGVAVPTLFPARAPFDMERLARVPIRPLIGALVVNVLVWTVVAYFGYAAILSIRGSMRIVRSRCLQCGHTLVEQTQPCPECGALFATAKSSNA